MFLSYDKPAKNFPSVIISSILVSCFLPIFYLVLLMCFLSYKSIYCTNTNHPDNPSVNKCPKLESDFKFSSENFNGRDIRVPPHLVVNRRSFIFRLADKDVKCTGNEKFFKLSWESNEKISQYGRTENSETEIRDAFSTDGRIRFQLRYYLPEEYCISKLTADHITVKICHSNCDSTSLPCIKKCCDADQVLNYQQSLSSQYNFTPQCEDSRGKAWMPTFYSSTSDRTRIHNDPRQDKETNFRLTKVNLPCGRPIKISLGDVSHSHLHGYRLKMLQNGVVYIYQAEEKTWESLSNLGTYCIDGIHNLGPYTGDESEQMALLCVSDPNFESKRRYAVMSDVYFGVYFFSSIFLFLMVVVYLLLLDKQNLHGQTVLSYAITMFLQYIFFGIVHYLNSIRFDEPEGTARWDCFFLAIVVHYLYLSSFCWLTVMNYDLFMTFSSLKLMTPSSISHFYQMYCFSAWGLPTFFIFLFVILDISISRDTGMAMLPTYGADNCYISRDALGPFLFYLLAAILIGNLILIVLTFWRFYQIKSSVNETNKALEKFSLWKIFLRLFLVMAVAWVFEILSWINIGSESKWYWAVVDVLVILQAVAVFIVYCCNERTNSELESKYPGIMKWIKKLCCCRCTSSSSDSETSSLFRKKKRTRIVGYT